MFELATASFLTSHLLRHPCVQRILMNRRVRGCKLRPDILIQSLSHHSIIVEVDEQQHKAYDACEEVSRMQQLSEALLPHGTVFLRFNPHVFCREGVVGFHVPWEQRLATLANTICLMLACLNQCQPQAQTMVCPRRLQCLHLFFDE